MDSPLRTSRSSRRQITTPGYCDIVREEPPLPPPSEDIWKHRVSAEIKTKTPSSGRCRSSSGERKPLATAAQDFNISYHHHHHQENQWLPDWLPEAPPEDKKGKKKKSKGKVSQLFLFNFLKELS